METSHSGPQTRRFPARTATSRNERSLGAATATPAREIRATNQAESFPARQKRQLLSRSRCVLKTRSSRGTSVGLGAVLLVPQSPPFLLSSELGLLVAIYNSGPSV